MLHYRCIITLYIHYIYMLYINIYHKYINTCVYTYIHTYISAMYSETETMVI